MELSNEEQIALETLKEVASYDFDTLGDDISPRMAQNILNVINKQQEKIDNKYNQEERDEETIPRNKIREKIDKYREKLEKLHSQELWNEPEDSIKDFKYNHYIEAYKELLEEDGDHIPRID